MKLAEFKALCDREWGEARGDITGLSLTNDSLREFTTDVLLAGAQDQPFLFPLVPLYGSDEIANIRAGAVCSKVLNPVTRTVVDISGGADEDKAEVRRYYAEPHPAGLPCT